MLPPSYSIDRFLQLQDNETSVASTFVQLFQAFPSLPCDDISNLYLSSISQAATVGDRPKSGGSFRPESNRPRSDSEQEESSEPGDSPVDATAADIEERAQKLYHSICAAKEFYAYSCVGLDENSDMEDGFLHPISRFKISVGSSKLDSISFEDTCNLINGGTNDDSNHSLSEGTY